MGVYGVGIRQLGCPVIVLFILLANISMIFWFHFPILSRQTWEWIGLGSDSWGGTHLPAASHVHQALLIGHFISAPLCGAHILDWSFFVSKFFLLQQSSISILFSKPFNIFGSHLQSLLTSFISIEPNSLQQCHESIDIDIIKGIRDAGSTAEFRILFEILKFRNLKI